MPEQLRLTPRSARPPSPTRRDLLAMIYRRQRLAFACFTVCLLAAILYRLLAPAYQAEMSVLVRHGRIHPGLAWAPARPRLEPDEVSEKELNSEVELLHDQEILRTVAKAARLDSEGASWFRKLVGETDEERLARAVRRLDDRLSVAKVRKTALIRVTFQSSDPSHAAAVLNCLAGAYLARHASFDPPPGEANFSEQQVVESRRRLDEAQWQLVEFSRDRGSVPASGPRAAHPVGERGGDRADQQDELLNQLSAAEDQYLLDVDQRAAEKTGDGPEPERTLNVILAEQPTAPALPTQSALAFGGLGLVCAGAFGTAIALLVDVLNPVFRTPDDVVAYLGTPVLASLPRRALGRTAQSRPRASP